MKMRNLLALTATALIAYSGTVSAQPDCAQLPGLLLTIEQYSIDLNDRRPVCVEIGKVFIIQIVNPSAGGHIVKDNDVEVEQKVELVDAKVAIKGNSARVDNRLVLAIAVNKGPKWTPLEEPEEFEYWIKIKDVGTLDPRIRVIPSEEAP